MKKHAAPEAEPEQPEQSFPQNNIAIECIQLRARITQIGEPGKTEEKEEMCTDHRKKAEILLQRFCM